MRWNRTIWDEMLRMQEEMDRMMEGFFGEPGLDEKRAPAIGYSGESGVPALANFAKPLTDIVEDEKSIKASIDLPGVDKKDIEINVTDNIVEVKVEKKAEKKQEDKKKGVYRMERRYAGFYRCFGLPEYADTSKMQAEYKNGVLELDIPKKPEAARKARKIAVK
jgi:HSP20 family protein